MAKSDAYFSDAGKPGYHRGVAALVWETSGNYDRRLLAVIVGNADASEVIVSHREKDAAARDVVSAIASLKGRLDGGTPEDVIKKLANMPLLAGPYALGAWEIGYRNSLSDVAADLYADRLNNPHHYHSKGVVGSLEQRDTYDMGLERQVKTAMLGEAPTMSEAEVVRAWPQMRKRLAIGPANPDAFRIATTIAPGTPGYEHLIPASFIVVSTRDAKGGPGDPIKMILVAGNGNGYVELQHDWPDLRLAAMNDLMFALDELAFWPATADHADYRAQMEAKLADHPPFGPQGPWTPEMLGYLRERLSHLYHITQPQTVLIGSNDIDAVQVLNNGGGYLKAKAAIWTGDLRAPERGLS